MGHRVGVILCVLSKRDVGSSRKIAHMSTVYRFCFDLKRRNGNDSIVAILKNAIPFLCLASLVNSKDLGKIAYLHQHGSIYSYIDLTIVPLLLVELHTR